MSQSGPNSPGPIRLALWIVYDLLWISLGALIYGLAAWPGLVILQLAWRHWEVLGLAFAILPVYVLFLLILVVEMAAIRWVSPRVRPGVYEKFHARQFFALVWLTGVHKLLDAMPFTRTVHFVAFLRYLYFRGQGTRTYFENWISPDATLHDPWLIELGRGVNVGARVSMGCHLALPDKMIVRPIVLGDRVIVGALSMVAPGVEVGEGSVVGASVGLSFNVKVGKGAYIEPGSIVVSGTVIGAYERWGGHPAVKISDLPRRESD